MKKKIIFYLVLLVNTFGHGQVIVNDTSTDASSAFSITSSDKGVLLPKIDLPSVLTSQLDGINTAADGMLIYNTNSSIIDGDGVGYYMFSASLGKWERVLTPKATIGILPIGSIVAWHDKIDFPALTLSEGWQLCDGSVVSDTESPLNGMAVPDLNGGTTSEAGDLSSGKFLRGGAVSGLFETDQANTLSEIRSSTASGGSSVVLLNENGSIGNLTTDDADGGAFGSSDKYGFYLRGIENRVVNMSIKYIIRIK